MSKWIDFIEQAPTGKTKRFNIMPKDLGPMIGEIKWYGPWRKYCFFPKPNCVFETDCLKDIISFLSKLMLDRKIEKQNSQL